MNGTTPIFLTCTEIRRRLRGHFLTQSEVPTQHAISFPLPTLRWGSPGYAMFASPALRLAGRPMEQSAPDCWWVMGAKNGRLIAYALNSAVPFGSEDWTPVVLAPVPGTIGELRAAMANLEKLMNDHSPAFFSGEAGVLVARQELKQALVAVLPGELLPQYRALAPDFWNWLEAL